MARQRERICLEQGLKLDLVQLARRGSIQSGSNLGPRRIQWTDRMSGELIATGVITADLRGSDSGWLQINMEHFQQCFQLILMPRHFGGGQWYFLCSGLDRPASVLWRPPGALFFRCRQYWGRRVAYLCQFGNPIDRAHIGRAKLKAKLCSPDLDDWRIPPKPPKMRWATYDRLIEQYTQQCRSPVTTTLIRHRAEIHYDAGDDSGEYPEFCYEQMCDLVYYPPEDEHGHGHYDEEGVGHGRPQATRI
jgi:hypothetical protein